MNKLKCKLYITDCTNPYQNLAAEEMLLRFVKPDEVILYLWQNDNTVVIGRNQNAWRECRLESFTAQKGNLARRLSGGGAVYHDMGNQNFTFLAHNDFYDVSRQSDVICHAAQRFGIKAIRNGRNDILADERKFSGNAFYSTGKVKYHHGTILISSDMAKLGEFLSPSKEKLEAKGVQSVRSRVINLCELAPNINPQAMRQALIASFAEIYDSSIEFVDASIFDKGELERLTLHYGSREWTLGRLSEFNQRFYTRLSFGEIELQITVIDGIIKDAVMYSDALDADWVDAVREGIKGSAFNSAYIREKLSKMDIDTKQTEEFYDYLSSVID